ncbi:MAG: DUF3488 domain-containing protein, partial [Nitriliruptorales bacterium]|nr:DUF3488 domain-containing protein [Nitriliruptorales bacterium]
MTRSALSGMAGMLCVLAALFANDRLFSDGAWILPALIAVLVATGLAAAIRALRLHAVVSAILSAIALFVTTHILLLESSGLLPGLDQLTGIAELARAGVQAIQDHVAPVPTEPGLVLFVLAGTWVLAHATYEVSTRLDVGAVGLVVPSVLWIVPVVIPTREPRVTAHTVPFLFAAVIYLLVTAERDVAGMATDGRSRRFSLLGAGVGSLAVLLAVALPLTALGYGAEAWIDLDGAANPRGYQPIVDVGDRLKTPEPRDLLIVRSQQPSYLRIAALETFDGTSWRIGPPSAQSFRPSDQDLFEATDALPPEVPITGRQRQTSTEVEVLELENIYVPVPYQPLRVRGPDAGSMVYSRVGGFVATGELLDG